MPVLSAPNSDVAGLCRRIQRPRTASQALRKSSKGNPVKSDSPDPNARPPANALTGFDDLSFQYGSDAVKAAIAQPRQKLRSEEALKREEARLRRVITSADSLYPTRHSLKKLGIQDVEDVRSQQVSSEELISLIQPDIHTGIWSCCRSTKIDAPGCMVSQHATSRFLCSKCGVLYDTHDPKSAPSTCNFHPGSVFRSKAGGVWWSCCGAVGFENSLYHSARDLGSNASWRWGCRVEKQHSPLHLFDPSVDEKKYVHCTVGKPKYSELDGPDVECEFLYANVEWQRSDKQVECCRIVSMTVIGQPLLPCILGVQLRYEMVVDGEIVEGDRRLVRQRCSLAGAEDDAGAGEARAHPRDGLPASDPRGDLLLRGRRVPPRRRRNARRQQLHVAVDLHQP
eukprot:753595-Hanusia_phi.AAC.2